MLTENGLTTCRACGRVDEIYSNGYCEECVVDFVFDWEFDDNERYAIVIDWWN